MKLIYWSVLLSNMRDGDGVEGVDGGGGSLLSFTLLENIKSGVTCKRADCATVKICSSEVLMI